MTHFFQHSTPFYVCFLYIPLSLAMFYSHPFHAFLFFCIYLFFFLWFFIFFLSVFPVAEFLIFFLCVYILYASFYIFCSSKTTRVRDFSSSRFCQCLKHLFAVQWTQRCRPVKYDVFLRTACKTPTAPRPITWAGKIITACFY